MTSSSSSPPIVTPVVLQCNTCRYILAETTSSARVEGRWRVRNAELAMGRVADGPLASSSAGDSSAEEHSVKCASCYSVVGKEVRDGTSVVMVVLDNVESYDLRRTVPAEDLQKLKNDVLDIKEVLMTIVAAPEEERAKKRRRAGEGIPENSPFSSPQRVLV